MQTPGVSNVFIFITTFANAAMSEHTSVPIPETPPTDGRKCICCQGFCVLDCTKNDPGVPTACDKLRSIVMTPAFGAVVLLAISVTCLVFSVGWIQSTQSVLSPCYQVTMQDRLTCLQMNNGVVCQFAAAVMFTTLSGAIILTLVICVCLLSCDMDVLANMQDCMRERRSDNLPQCVNCMPNRALCAWICIVFLILLPFVLMFTLTYSSVYTEQCRGTDDDCNNFSDAYLKQYTAGVATSAVLLGLVIFCPIAGALTFK